jgi:hypothetical protein
MIVTPPIVIDWVADSAASKHTTSYACNLTTFQPFKSTVPSSIIVGNGFVLSITLVGDMVLLDPFYLNNILVTHNIIQNLLSVHHFTTSNWCYKEIDLFVVSRKDLCTRNMITRCNSMTESPQK